MKDSEQFQGVLAWPVSVWARAVGISRASTFVLLREGRIESAKFGAKRLILTNPKDFLERLKDVRK